MEQTYLEDPRRCTFGSGQCNNISVEGFTKCEQHYSSERKSKEAKDLKNYRLTRWRGRVSGKSNSEAIKSLTEEIGILRMLMEERLEQCHDETDLIYASQDLADLTLKIEKLVTSCHKLESQMGHHLDKTTVLQFAATVIDIIGQEIDDIEIIDSIAERITKALQ